MSTLCQKPAHELARLLASREVSSEELTRAHLDRIAERDGALHAFTTVLRDEAIAAARRADEERRRGEVRGPLHGLPISIKESLDCVGHASTLGAASRKGTVAKEDAAVVELFRKAGAVILGRTNVSQLLLFHESRNPIFGQTANPWSLDHTPGGSSGGEGAAIAAGMAPLGVGTDIGGSIRVPAHFCGIAGLKPTLDRWSNKGSNTSMLGQEGIRSQLGPMARSAKDLVLAMQALDPRAFTAIDGRVPPLPFEDPARVDVARLRVGVYTDDGVLSPSAAVVRAVREAADALRARGAEVVDFTPPGLPDAVYAYFSALTADGGTTALGAIEGEPIDRSLSSMKLLTRVPPQVRATAARVARLAGEKRLARFLESVGARDVAAYWKLIASLRSERADIAASMRAANIDVILCPPHATPALPHGLSRDFALAGTPAMLWNIVQFPAGVVPVTRVRAAEAARPNASDRLEKQAAEVDRRSAGLPVGVQVVARPWEEDTLLAAMVAIEEGVSQSADFPRAPV
ncbi:Aspartyl-tRNA(Asn) amidotransferase subunit A [Minicystis rosea]|nr:Aspartyl-tRNA(Asn) amidotransferase subunit A [Minicystis rosea]